MRFKFHFPRALRKKFSKIYTIYMSIVLSVTTFQGGLYFYFIIKFIIIGINIPNSFCEYVCGFGSGFILGRF